MDQNRFDGLVKELTDEGSFCLSPCRTGSPSPAGADRTTLADLISRD